MAKLRTYGVTTQTHLKLEYFFYTNSEAKAKALAETLAGMGYDGGYSDSSGDDSLFLINGWTSPISMNDRTVTDWTARMCDLGQEHDCEFDGWGTEPDQ